MTVRAECESQPSLKRLTFDEVNRLSAVLREAYPLRGLGHFPTLQVEPFELINTVSRRLDDEGIQVKQVRMNGSAASHVLHDTGRREYNDLDILFRIDLGDELKYQQIRTSVLTCLLDYMPSGVSKERLCSTTLEDAYVKKMVKVFNEHDRWSLLSLRGEKGRNLELKFVDTMRREYEFSVDSFQIILDDFLAYSAALPATNSSGPGRPLSPHFFPTVMVESLYGDIEEALEHLHNRILATKNPEEIRGGGLLKYCHLLAESFTPTDACMQSERYMCSRFFIDFSDVTQMHMKMQNYLDAHLSGNRERQHAFLKALYEVVSNSTVCLMSFEHKQALSLIRSLARKRCQREEWEGMPTRGKRSYTPGKQWRHSESWDLFFEFVALPQCCYSDDGNIYWLVPVEGQPIYM